MPISIEVVLACLSSQTLARCVTYWFRASLRPSGSLRRALMASLYPSHKVHLACSRFSLNFKWEAKMEEKMR